MEFSSLILTMPVWIDSFLERYTFPIKTVEERMLFVIALASENSSRKTGGPFAAALFDCSTGELLAPGVNRVIPLNCSIAHAEIMAIGLAQQRFDTFNLGESGCPQIELVTSTEPCAMCLGAIPWTGISKVVCGATDADARQVGFDEGTKSVAWIDDLELRNISVTTKVCRSEARSVLREYVERGGLLYNGGKGIKSEEQCEIETKTLQTPANEDDT